MERFQKKHLKSLRKFIIESKTYKRNEKINDLKILRKIWKKYKYRSFLFREYGKEFLPNVVHIISKFNNLENKFKEKYKNICE